MKLISPSIIMFRGAVATVVVLPSSKWAFSPRYSLDGVHHPAIPRLTPTTHPPHPALVSLSPYDTSLLTRSSAGPRSNRTFLLTPAALCVTDLQDVPPHTRRDTRCWVHMNRRPFAPPHLIGGRQTRWGGGVFKYYFLLKITFITVTVVQPIITL